MGAFMLEELRRYVKRESPRWRIAQEMGAENDAERVDRPLGRGVHTPHSASRIPRTARGTA
jgi:hypothetical protein